MVELFLTCNIPNVRQVGLFNKETGQLSSPHSPRYGLEVCDLKHLPRYIAPSIYVASVRKPPFRNTQHLFTLKEVEGFRELDNWSFAKCVYVVAKTVNNCASLYSFEREGVIIRSVTDDMIKVASSQSRRQYHHHDDNWATAAREVKYLIQKQFLDLLDCEFVEDLEDLDHYVETNQERRIRDGAKKVFIDFMLKSLIGGAFYNLVVGHHDSFAKAMWYCMKARSISTNYAYTALSGQSAREEVVQMVADEQLEILQSCL